MSQVMTVADVQKLDADIPIPALRGKLTTLYKRSAGETQKGKWSFQNGEIESGGAKMKVVFKDRDELPMSWKSKEVYLLSNNGSRGWSGVKTKMDDYKPEAPVMVVWVTGSAEITESSPVAGTPTAKPAAAPVAPPTAATAPRAAATPAKSDAGKINLARVFIARRAAGMAITFRATQKISKDFREAFGEEMPLQMFQAINSTLFIAGDKSGMFDDLPVDLSLQKLVAMSKQQPATNPAVAPQPAAPPPQEIPRCKDCASELEANGGCPNGCADDVPF